MRSSTAAVSSLRRIFRRDFGGAGRLRGAGGAGDAYGLDVPRELGVGGARIDAGGVGGFGRGATGNVAVGGFEVVVVAVWDPGFEMFPGASLTVVLVDVVPMFFEVVGVDSLDSALLDVAERVPRGDKAPEFLCVDG